MLQRSPSRRAGWQRNWRRRVRDGAKLAEVPGSMVELLLVSKWLKPHESDNKRAITEALDAFARAAIKNRLQTRGMFRAIF
jgi:hypothetical protein